MSVLVGRLSGRRASSAPLRAKKCEGIQCPMVEWMWALGSVTSGTE